MANTRVVGVTSLTIDGNHYNLVGELSYTIAIIKRETMPGMDGIHGFKEMPAPGKISFTLRDASNLTVGDFMGMTDVNIAAHLGNGKVVIANSFWLTDAPEVDAGEGTIKLNFEGIDISEVLA